MRRWRDGAATATHTGGDRRKGVVYPVWRVVAFRSSPEQDYRHDEKDEGKDGGDERCRGRNAEGPLAVRGTVVGAGAWRLGRQERRPLGGRLAAHVEPVRTGLCWGYLQAKDKRVD